MRSRFRNIDYFTQPFSDLEFPHLPDPHINNSSPSDPINIRDFLQFDSIPVDFSQFDSLAIEDALASFLLDVLPQPIEINEDDFPFRDSEIRDQIPGANEILFQEEEDYVLCEDQAIDRRKKVSSSGTSRREVRKEGLPNISGKQEEKIFFEVPEIELPLALVQETDNFIGPRTLRELNVFSHSIQVSKSEPITSIQVSEESLLATPPVYAPSFVILHGKNYENQTFCVPSDKSCHPRSVPQMCGMRCLGCCYSWLILHGFFTGECRIFDPATLKNIDLPVTPNFIFEIGVLTSPPCDQDCTVVLFCNEKRMFLFCKIGDVRWMKKALNPVHDALGEEYRSAVSWNNKVYLFREFGVEVFDTQNDFGFVDAYEIDIPLSSIMTKVTSRSHFLESDGVCFQVVLIFFDFSDMLVNFVVYKMNLGNMTAEEVDNLGGRNLLLGEPSGSACVAPQSVFGAQKNCIYYFVGSRTQLFVFNMDAGTITVSQLCRTDFFNWDGPFWMVPNNHEQLRKELPRVTKEIQVTNSRLLPELIEMIFQFLHLDGIIRFRLAVKAFINTNLPVRLFCPQALSNSQYLPWLIQLANPCLLYHPIYTDVYTMDLPQLRGALLRDSKFGWLLLSRRNLLFFFNPLTFETIEVPEQSNSVKYVNLSFSSPPTSSDCMIFAIEYSEFNRIIFSVYCKVKDCWSKGFCRDRSAIFRPAFCNPIYLKGMFYCMSIDGKIGILNPSKMEKEDMWRVDNDLSVPDLRETAMYNTRSFILECDGEIFAAFVGFLGTPVYVYKLQQSKCKKKMKWLKVESFGDRVMYLSHTTSLLLPAVLKGTANRIYLPLLKGSSFLYYSMSSGQYHSFRERESQSDWMDTCQMNWSCAWFQNA